MNPLNHQNPHTTNKEEKPRKEPSTLQILCIHHQNNDIGTQTTLDQLTQIAKTLNIKQIYTNPAPPTPMPIIINNKSQWRKTNSPPLIETQLYKTFPLPDYNTLLLLKFNPDHSYYTDGLFKEPTEGQRETAGYGIFNATKELRIAHRPYRLQNILRAEIMAIHKTLQILKHKISQ